MTDDNSSQSNQGSSWSRGLKRWLSTAPETRDELVKILHDSRQLLEPETVDMLEGVLDLPATKIHDIMTPISQVVAFSDSQPLSEIMDIHMNGTHSRYPVFASNSSGNDEVVGILLAKDLIPILVKKARGEPLPDFSCLFIHI